jgi:hypothetical protein
MSEFIKLPLDQVVSFKNELTEILLNIHSISFTEPLEEEKRYELNLRVSNLLTDVEDLIFRDHGE